MSIVDAAKALAVSFITPTGQTNPAEKKESAPVGSTFNFTEGNFNPQAIQPYNVGTCFSTDNKNLAAQRFYPQSSDRTYEASGDRFNLGDSSYRKIANGGLQDELTNVTLPRMMEATKTNRANVSIKDSYSNLYPETDGWIITNAGKLGVIAQNTKTGVYGTIKEDGSLEVPA